MLHLMLVDDKVNVECHRDHLECVREREQVNLLIGYGSIYPLLSWTQMLVEIIANSKKAKQPMEAHFCSVMKKNCKSL